MDKLKSIIIFQSIIIIFLAAILLYPLLYSTKTPKQQEKTHGLLSQRIYAGNLAPQSLLINNFEPLKSAVDYFLKENNISASIYIENLRNGANMGINQEQGYFPASLNKLPVAVLIMQEIEDGKLSFNGVLPIRDVDRTDSSGILYMTNATNLPVKVLLEKMIKESDNTAFNVLLHHADKKELARLLSYYDIKINVDYPNRRIEFINHTDLVTAESIYNFFSSLYLSTVLTPNDSEYLLSLLADANFDIKRIAHLPDNVTVVQKYGAYYLDDTEFFHDCGIMYIGDSRIFYCIMTKQLSVKQSEEAIGLIVNALHSYIVDTRAKLDIYKKNLKEGT